MNDACFVGLLSIVALGGKEQLVVLGRCDLTKVEDNALKTQLSFKICGLLCMRLHSNLSGRSTCFRVISGTLSIPSKN